MHGIRHIGIIMDGNRRFAKRLMKEPWRGHAWGKDKLQEVLQWCQDTDIKELTIYAFSVQNFNRPKKEFDTIMQYFREGLDELLDESDERLAQIKVRFVGRLEMLPEDIQERIVQAQEATKDRGPYTLNVAVAYGGREELTDAVRDIVAEVKDGFEGPITEETIAKHLLVQDEPDLIIRTGGERRMSNFLLWQASYAELFFVDSLWPEFSREEFDGILASYGARERRFGR